MHLPPIQTLLHLLHFPQAQTLMATPCDLYVTMTFLIAMTHLLAAHSGDPDIITDYIIPPSLNITNQFFTFTGFRNIDNPDNLAEKTTAVITKATMAEFPALAGQGVSAAMLVYPPGGINPPHTHPRATELFMVLRGTLEVGLVDSDNKVLMQTLQTSDMFVFPKGMAHFQVNVDASYPAVAIGMFGSADAGTVSLGRAIFGSGISGAILAKAFNTDEGTVEKIVEGI